MHNFTCVKGTCRIPTLMSNLRCIYVTPKYFKGKSLTSEFALVRESR